MPLVLEILRDAWREAVAPARIYRENAGYTGVHELAFAREAGFFPQLPRRRFCR